MTASDKESVPIIGHSYTKSRSSALVLVFAPTFSTASLCSHDFHQTFAKVSAGNGAAPWVGSRGVPESVLSMSMTSTLSKAKFQAFLARYTYQVASFCEFTRRGRTAGYRAQGRGNPLEIGGPGDRISPQKIQPVSLTLAPSKSQITSLFGVPSSPVGLLFVQCSTKIGSLSVGPLHSTLCPSITSTCFTPKFHFDTHQYSTYIRRSHARGNCFCQGLHVSTRSIVFCTGSKKLESFTQPRTSPISTLNDRR